MRRRFAIAIALLPSTGVAEEPPREGVAQAEYRIKAACLYRFLQFIEWPKSAFAEERSPLVVAVVGRDPFGELLDETMKGKTIAGRQIVVKRFATWNDVGPCHLAFISSSEEGKLKETIAALKPLHAATAGDVEGFTKAGGIFQFYLSEKKVQFEINREAAREARIEIRSQLLRLGKAPKTN